MCANQDLFSKIITTQLCLTVQTFIFSFNLRVGIKTHTAREIAEQVHNTTKILHIITFMSGVLCEGALALL
jgi:hypothetical protein